MIQLVQAGQDRSQLVAKVLADLPNGLVCQTPPRNTLTRPATGFAFKQGRAGAL